MLSPKQIGTICLSFSLILISTKSFSENIPSNPTCDNATLGVYSGSAALEPDWGANKIPIRWYNNNTLITDVTAQESECTYDGTLDVATEPVRTGYNFSGWTVRPERSFDTLKTALYTTEQKSWSKGGYCTMASGTNPVTIASCLSDTNFFELQQHEWKTESNKGTIYGMAYCSGKTGDNHNLAWGGDSSDWKATKEELISASGAKQQCWCNATGWLPMGEQTIYAPDDTLFWVFVVTYDAPLNCSALCAGACLNSIHAYAGFRAALFSPVTTNNQ